MAHRQRGAFCADGLSSSAESGYDKRMGVAPSGRDGGKVLEPRARKHISLGVAYLQMGWADGAREELERALALDPFNTTALFYAGLACMETSDLGAAESYLRTALRHNPDNPDAFAGLAKLYLKRNRPNEASIYARNALDKAKLHPMAVSVLAEIEVSKGRLQRAEVLLQESLAVHPGNTDLHTQLGLLLARTGKSYEAVYHLRRALETNPAHRKAAIALARCYLVLGDKEAAIRTLNSLLSHLGNDIFVLRFLSRLYFEGGDLDASARCLALILRVQPADSDALRRLASLRLQQGRHPIAYRLARRLLLMLPEDAEGHRIAAAACEAMGDTAGELRHLREACKSDPHSASTLSRLVERLIESDPEQAIIHARKLVSVLPNAASWTLLGRACISTGDKEAAVYALRRAVSLSTPDPTPHYLLARLIPNEHQIHLRSALLLDTNLTQLPDDLRLSAFKLLARHRIRRTGRLLAKYRFLLHLLPASVSVFENGVLLKRGLRNHLFVPYVCLATKPIRRREPRLRRFLLTTALGGLALFMALTVGVFSLPFAALVLLTAASSLETLSSHSVLVFADAATGEAVLEVPVTQRGIKTAAKIEQLLAQNQKTSHTPHQS